MPLTRLFSQVFNETTQLPHNVLHRGCGIEVHRRLFASLKMSGKYWITIVDVYGHPAPLTRYEVTGCSSGCFAESSSFGNQNTVRSVDDRVHARSGFLAASDIK
jgi:hypothetical protein